MFTTLVPTFAFADETLNGNTVILYTSNLRGDIDSLSQIASVKSDYESKGADVILADTGNFLQGSIYASADRGYTVFNLMEQTGYDVVALGKYEFTFGDGTIGAKAHGSLVQYFTLSTLLNGGTANSITKSPSTFKAVSANADGSNSYFTFKNNMCASTTVTTKSGFTVGFVGLTNPDTKNCVLEDSLAGITFDSDSDMYNDSKIISRSLKSSSDVVVCLSNVGDVDSTKTGANVTIDVREDAGETVGAVVINSNGEVISNDVIDVSKYTADSQIKSAVDSAKAAIDLKYTSVAKSTVTLEGSTSAVRSKETNLGDFWTDALRWFALDGGIENYFSDEYKELGNTSIKVDDDKVVAIWNGGNLRDYMYSGDIILQDIQRVLPYPNTVAVVYVTGAQLLEALEASMQYDAAFASVSGIEYNIDPNKSFVQGEQYSNSKYYAPKTINKVTITSINGKPFDEKETYAVITSNMIYNGGDTYGVFKSKSSDSTITSIKVTDAVWSYVQNKLGGVIGDDYASCGTRITTKHNHSYDSGKVTKKATCTENGVKTYTCVDCGSTKTKTIKATGHKAVTDKAVAATYAKAGKTEGSHCSVCGTVIKAQKSVAKLTVSATSITKLTSVKKGFKITYKKNSKATGYQIQYSTDKNFKKNNKTVTISKNSTTSKTVSSLSANKKYYVRVRCYKTENGKKYYSSWSSSKSVTTKK
jgi:2',3'-cyclic-nucleotide 2'-phosphodiesterase (5'-nucleotidase family)